MENVVGQLNLSQEQQEKILKWLETYEDRPAFIGACVQLSMETRPSEQVKLTEKLMNMLGDLANELNQ